MLWSFIVPSGESSHALLVVFFSVTFESVISNFGMHHLWTTVTKSYKKIFIAPNHLAAILQAN